MGRTRKPTATKVYEGNPGGKRLTADDYSPAGVPVCPVGLSPQSQTMWDFLVPELISKGVAKRCDTPALIGLVQWWGRYAEASAEMADTETDYRLMVIAGMAWKNFERIASRFGLTPSARAGLRLGQEQTSDKLTEFLNAGKTCSKR